MTVFRGFLTLVKRNLSMFFLYLGIFVVISVSIQKLNTDSGVTSFSEEALEIAIIDKDGGILAQGLTDYLAEKHVLVEVQDSKAAIQEKLFYRDIYYVVTIPEDFENKVLNQGEKLETTKLPGTTTAFYVDQQIDTFLNNVRILKEAGFTTEEAIDEVEEIGKTEAEVTLLDKNGYGGAIASHVYTFRMMPYLILSVLCYVLGFIMIEYRRKEIRQRIQCSKVSLRQQNLQLILAYLLLGVVFWGICMLLPIILHGKEFLTDTNMVYYVLDAFVMILVSLAISFVIGVIVENADHINGVVNVVSLGMSFLCGVFVPVEFLGESVRTFSKFLPAYWYEQVVEIAANNAAFTAEQTKMIWQAYGIQMLFAVGIVCVGLVVSKYKQQE